MHNEHNENEKHNELNVVNVFEPQVNHGFVLTEKEREEIEGETPLRRRTCCLN